MLEVTLIKLCRPADGTEHRCITRPHPCRLRSSSKRERGKHRSESAVVYGIGCKQRRQHRSRKPELPQALNEDVKAVAKDFRMIINEASPMLSTYLKKARLSAGEGNRLLIVLPDELIAASAVATPEHKEEIQSADRAEDWQKSRDRRPPDGGGTQIRRSLCGSGESD